MGRSEIAEQRPDAHAAPQRAAQRMLNLEDRMASGPNAPPAGPTAEAALDEIRDDLPEVAAVEVERLAT